MSTERTILSPFTKEYRERDYRFIRLETDSLSVFEAVHSKDSGLEDSLIVHDMSRGKSIGETLFERPPIEVLPLLDKDMIVSCS
ncbi:hypothetical protein GQ457_07G034520 [Hibiscus cannabinus]